MARRHSVAVGATDSRSSSRFVREFKLPRGEDIDALVETAWNDRGDVKRGTAQQGRRGVRAHA